MENGNGRQNWEWSSKNMLNVYVCNTLLSPTISWDGCSIPWLLRAHAQRCKVIGSVVVVVHTKFARSRGIGVFTGNNCRKNVRNGEKPTKFAHKCLIRAMKGINSVFSLATPATPIYHTYSG